jgi:hypothetical protein
VAKGPLRSLTNVQEWIVPGYERAQQPPVHEFFSGLLHHYKVELQHLNPNGVQQTAAFIALCEGFLGIPLYFSTLEVLLWHLTSVSEAQRRVVPPIGYLASTSTAANRAAEYMDIHLTKSNKGWHITSFYLKNDD